MTATDKTPMLELFTDFVCPWCYLGNAVLTQFTAKETLTVRRTPFPLHPDTPPEGLPLAELLPGRDLGDIHRKLYAVMDELGLEHGERRYTYNSRLAQELALWADTQREGRPLDALLYRAYFVHDQNLADSAVLLPLVEQAGLDVAEAEQVLQTRRHSEDVDEAWARCRRYGINSVPSYVMGGYLSSGFMPLADFQRFVDFVREKAESDN
ncbi:MAG TPA: DsbA family protein [Hyphomicrobiales bacterium]|nr:DsbA family protein [Hyphomicrobiales bacterium]